MPRHYGRHRRGGRFGFGLRKSRRERDPEHNPLRRNRRSHKFYRIANEVPTLLMIVIVVMVIVKPF